MSDIHALSGAYAVDALDDLERAQFERHLAECPICEDEVFSLREASALLAETSAAAPSAALRAKVLSDIATVRPLPPVVQPVRVVERRRRFPALMAAAAAVVALLAGGVAWQVTDDGPQSQVEQVIAAGDAQTFTQSFPNGATATVVRSKKLNKAVLITEDMPAAPAGHSYAAWLQHGGDMVLAGIMPSGSNNEVVLSGDAASANGAGITVETNGTEHESPKGEVVALFDFEA